MPSAGLPQAPALHTPTGVKAAVALPRSTTLPLNWQGAGEGEGDAPEGRGVREGEAPVLSVAVAEGVQLGVAEGVAEADGGASMLAMLVVVKATLYMTLQPAEDKQVKWTQIEKGAPRTFTLSCDCAPTLPAERRAP